MSREGVEKGGHNVRSQHPDALNPARGTCKNQNRRKFFKNQKFDGTKKIISVDMEGNW